MQQGQSDAIKDRIVNTYYDGSSKRANTHVMLQAPSFVFKANDMAFGFRTQMRTDLSVRNVPADIAKLSFVGLNQAGLNGTSTNLEGLRVGGMTWMQYSLSAGMPLNHSDGKRWVLGVSLNYISAIEAAYVNIKSGTLSVGADTSLSLNNMTGTADHAFMNDPHQLNILKCNGMSTDIGVYKIVNPARLKFSAGRPVTTKRYDYRMGISLIDAGFVAFNNQAQSFNFNDASVTYQKPSTIKASGIKGVDSLLQASLMQGAMPATHFIMAMPTALSFQYDQALSTYFYFNMSAVQRIRLPMAQVDRPNSISATLRFETPYFEASLPYSFYDYYRHRLGFALRYHVFFAGTDDLGTFAGRNDITGFDVYFGLKITNFDFRKRVKALCCKSFF
jgi:hypothetical protein